MNKLFKNQNMSWLKVTIMSLITGIYTGIIMCIPILNNTSFQDIGISYECWVLFALIIVTNCKKWYEAMFKCFIFFLISQPIIFLVEVLLSKISMYMGLYYYFGIWFKITLLTLPGGLIAYYSKKQNIIGSIILGIGNTILMILGIYYTIVLFKEFPYHLLSALFCFITIIFITLNIQEKKKYRIISLIVPVLLTLFILIFVKLSGLSLV